MKTRFVGSDVWREIDRALRRSPRTIAVAYFSSAQFAAKRSDVILTNACEEAIATGQTSASTLLAAARSGARVYSLSTLHAKIFLTPNVVFVGSANLSNSSRKLNEAGIVSTNAEIIREVNRYVALLLKQASRLNIGQLKRLAAIPVAKRGRAIGAQRGRRPSLLDALSSPWCKSRSVTS
jgi:phosphatidylserine/phosphatidylglycerophosphate/cardiolipin synthase-like enzyme